MSFDGEFDDDDFTDIEDDDSGLDVAAAILAKQREVLERLAAPKPYNLKQTKKRIAVIDTETDPFAYGRVPAPFCVGFDTGERYVDFWGDDCVAQFFAYLATLTAEGDEYIIYAHNGGKFDFHFFLDYLDQDQNPFIMNGRLVRLFFQGQEFRDSFSIIPQKLSAYKKDEIDYALFERGTREKHRAEILSYMKGDCIYARELIVGFHDLFGDKLTVASAALPMLHSFHGFRRMTSDAQDAQFRQYYYGGRNQCFETGKLHNANGWRVYDVNSMYPDAMKRFMHPVGIEPEIKRDIDAKTDFACIEAINHGALPMRALDGSLDFTVKRGAFYATGHEIRAGLETGSLEILRVKHAWQFDRHACFAEFVDMMFQKRQEAKDVDDTVRAILYKFCLNSPYGKFAMNPRKFKQYCMTLDSVPDGDNWALESVAGPVHIWSRPAPRRNGFYNVATAASITGAARSVLLRGLSVVKRPIYCDTDSIVCENGDRLPIDDRKLGFWKLEEEGDMAAIAGKKLYSIWRDGVSLKSASKGVSLTPEQIVEVCNGSEIVYQNPAPTFALGGETAFLERRINMTTKG